MVLKYSRNEVRDKVERKPQSALQGSQNSEFVVKMELGQIVYSKAGRDSGRYFAVVEIVDDDYVKIADGKLRKLKNAKLKKVKHLKTNGDRLEKIAHKLNSGTQVFDAELRSALRAFNGDN
jgi:large subunit ribosomal protein L14e